MEKFMFKQTTNVNGVTQPPKVTFAAPDAIQPDTTPVSEQPTQVHLREVPRPTGDAAIARYFRRLVQEFKQAKTAVLISFSIGAAIGLCWLGWYVFPVEWTGGSYTDLRDEDKIAVIEVMADLNAYDPQTPQVMKIGRYWPEMSDWACAIARQEADPAQRARLGSLAWRQNGYGCQ